MYIDFFLNLLNESVTFFQHFFKLMQSSLVYFCKNWTNILQIKLLKNYIWILSDMVDNYIGIKRCLTWVLQYWLLLSCAEVLEK